MLSDTKIQIPVNDVNYKNGVIYTPNFIVNNMLDLIGYNTKQILKKHIIDNSCGEGAFLMEVVRRYISIARKNNLNELQISSDLENFIHGIEIERLAYENCINNLNNILAELNVNVKIKWDIVCGDALKVNKFDNIMDYVVGNPPYIRIHDLQFNYRDYHFSSEGMTDLYLIFFEISLKMLNNKGKLIYITPNSFFTSKAALNFRKYLIKNNLIRKIVNLGHFNPFKDATTYTAISLLSKTKNRKKAIRYYEYNRSALNVNFVEQLEYNDFFIRDSFYFGKINELKIFKKVILTEKNPNIFVKNGVSTNLDAIFYNKNYSGKFIHNALKISKLEETKVFFPYDKDGNLIPLNEIKFNNPEIYKILKNNEANLRKRSLHKQEWYEFARTQGLIDIEKKRLVINNIIKNIETIKTKIIKPGIIPYSGYYILTNKYDYSLLEDLIKNIEFIDYLKILGKDKNGEYYFFSSADLHIYLSYKIKKVGIN